MTGNKGKSTETVRSSQRRPRVMQRRVPSAADDAVAGRWAVIAVTKQTTGGR